MEKYIYRFVTLESYAETVRTDRVAASSSWVKNAEMEMSNRHRWYLSFTKNPLIRGSYPEGENRALDRPWIDKLTVCQVWDAQKLVRDGYILKDGVNFYGSLTQDDVKNTKTKELRKKLEYFGITGKGDKADLLAKERADEQEVRVLLGRKIVLSDASKYIVKVNIYTPDYLDSSLGRGAVRSFSNIGQERKFQNLINYVVRRSKVPVNVFGAYQDKPWEDLVEPDLKVSDALYREIVKVVAGIFYKDANVLKNPEKSLREAINRNFTDLSDYGIELERFIQDIIAKIKFFDNAKVSADLAVNKSYKDLKDKLKGFKKEIGIAINSMLEDYADYLEGKEMKFNNSYEFFKSKGLRENMCPLTMLNIITGRFFR